MVKNWGSLSERLDSEPRRLEREEETSAVGDRWESCSGTGLGVGVFEPPKKVRLPPSSSSATTSYFEAHRPK